MAASDFVTEAQVDALVDALVAGHLAQRAYTDGLVVATQGPPGAVRDLNPLWGRLRAALAARNAGPVPIVFCGSSTIAGSDASEAGKRFANLLTAAIQAAYPSTNAIAMRTLAEAVAAMPLSAGIQGVNAGVGGVYADAYLTSTTAAQVGALNPRLVLHMITSNDYAGSRHPTTQTAAAIAQRIDWINAAVTGGVVPLHLLVHPFHRGDVLDGSVSYPWSAYAAALKSLAESRTDCLFVDTSPFFDACGLPSSNALGLLSSAGGPHLSDVGHAMIADLVRSAIEIPDVPQAATASSNPMVVVDLFDRADGALGTCDTGQAWATAGGAATIANRKLSVAAASTFTGTVDSGKTATDVSADITWQGQVTSIIQRSDASTTNRVSLAISGATTLRLYSTIAGTTTVVGTDVTITSLVVGTTYTLRSRLTGTTLQAYLNGSLVGTWTIPTDLHTATSGLTRVGLRVASTGSVARTIDNFTAKAI